jgi:uncharacterized paraquat-inducible protein A
MTDEELDDKDQGPDEQEVREESEPRRCPHCKATVADDADICPRCKRDLAEPAGKKVFSIIVLLMIIAVLAVGVWASFFAKLAPPSNAPASATSQNAP